MTKGKMVDMLEKLECDELRILNKLVIEKIHEKSRDIALSFNVGDIVYFYDKQKQKHEGTIVKINKKYIKVEEKAKEKSPFVSTWDVFPTYLNRVNDGNKQQM